MLQDQLDALKASFEETAPRQAVAIMRRATADLVASGLADRALKAGDVAPAFALPDSAGGIVRSAGLLANGPLVIAFYRGVWCPFCNLDLQALEARTNDIRARGAAFVAVSPQTQVNSRKAQADLKLSFPLLTDQGSEIANAFGLRFRLPEDLLAVYKGLGVDLATINGEPSGALPMPARYVIGQDGLIVYGEVNPDYTRRPDPSVLLAPLERLRPSHAA